MLAQMLYLTVLEDSGHFFFPVHSYTGKWLQVPLDSHLLQESLHDLQAREEMMFLPARGFRALVGSSWLLSTLRSQLCASLLNSA